MTRMTRIIATLALVVMAGWSQIGCAEKLTAQALQADPDRDAVVLVDVRTLEEWKDGHVSGARHVPLQQLDALAPGALPDKDARIVTYCRSGRRAARAADELEKLGYTHVTPMTGGFADLVRAGFPAEK